VFTFIGGVSAASAMVIVTTLALSSMCLNHILVPASYPDPALNLYRWLLWGRRLLIGLIIMAGYGFYVLLEHNEGLVELGLISFVAVAQFLPGIVGVLYWRRATRTGFAMGLLGGITVWAVVLLGPLLEQSGAIVAAWDFRVLATPLGLQDKWSFVTFASLSVNGLLFVVFSLLTRPSPEELRAADACCAETLVPPVGVVALHSPAQFREQLSRILGEDAATREVEQALQDLSLQQDERRPAELRLLRDRIERNLSGLLGPQMAHVIVNRRIGLEPGTQTALADTMRYFDSRLEESRSRLQGLAAELDRLRRYHRRVLHELPLGVCSVSMSQEIVIWNTAMTAITGLDERTASGRRMEDLPEPWAGMLRAFLRGNEDHLYKLQITVGARSRWFNLHKSAIDPRGRDASWRTGEELGGTVVLIEDLTELHNLESEVAHSDRLASIGRLAAGVAHEIGNPLTGIASLAQNLRVEHDPAEIEAAVTRILEQTRRIDSIVQSLISFSHVGTPAAAPGAVDLEHCVDEAIGLVQLGDRARQVLWQNEVGPGTRVSGDYQRLIQVFVNLLSNAVDASQRGGSVTIRASRQPRGVVIEVEDQGSGIAPDLHEQIFEPFFTTKPPGQGTGLGLAMVYSIIEDHAGSIVAQSVPDGGTRFVITLPAVDEALEA
jgi:signal transduction histidine kinase